MGVDNSNCLSHNSLFVFNLQVTYAFRTVSSQPLTGDSHFHMLPYEVHLAVGLSSFVGSFSWTRVVIITQDLPVFIEVHTKSEEV